MTRKFFALTAAVLVLASPTVTLAQGKMMGHDKMMHGKMMGKKMVGYCAECKMYYSAADTKKMMMKDSMGHKLMMTPMSKVPKGTKMGMAGKSMMKKPMMGDMKKPM